MDKEALALRLLMIGFEGKTPTPFVLDLIRRGLGGVILFKRNVESPAQVVALTNALSSAAPDRRLLISIDQEGGRVMRLREGFSAIPPMRRIGQTQDLSVARRIGAILGRELRAVGVNYNFAPVLDVDTNPQNPVIGDRSFSREPDEVAKMGLALAEGLVSEGVLPCGKHFPGHGDTLQDSHKVLPRLEKTLDELRRVELVPFREAAKAKLASLMTAHVVYPALDEALPATLSPKIVSQLLRRELGYEGVVVSDDLEMAAIADIYDIGEAAKMSLQAGLDIILVCHKEARQEAALQALMKCERSLLEQAAERVLKMASSLGAFTPAASDGAPQRRNALEDQAFLAALSKEPIAADPTGNL